VCVQFHPEASPGPHDCNFIFDRFLEHVTGWRASRAAKATGTGTPNVTPLKRGGGSHASA